MSDYEVRQMLELMMRIAVALEDLVEQGRKI